MKRLVILIAVSYSLLLTGCAQPEPPKTRKVPREFVEYGRKRVDDYYWLANSADSAVIEHLRQENAYTLAMLKHTEDLQQTIYDELVSRIDQKYESLPTMRNGYWYNIRYQEGKQYPLYCRRKGGPGAAEEVFLDVPRMAAGHQIYMVRGYSVSPDNTLLAYGIDTTGNRRSTLYVKDLTTSAMTPDVIPNTSGDYEWGNDNKSLFYVLNDRTVRAYRLMRHILGSDPATDREVYREGDSTFSVGVSSTRNHRYLFIGCGSTLTSEWRYLPADRPDARPVLIQARQHNVLYSPEDCEGDQFYIMTNKNAENFRLVKAPIRSPEMKSWVDVIPHRTDALLERAIVFTNYIVAQQMIGGLPRILVIDRKAKQEHYVEFAEQAYVADMSVSTDAYDLDSIRYSYTSLTTPRTEYRYDLATRQRTMLKQDKVGGGFDGSLYETNRIMVPAAGGVEVPMTIVFRKSNFRKDGSNPMLLYAYGSYGASMEPYFNPSVISLLDRGFVYGIAHIRGGQEMGRKWYEDGKVLKKKNTFNDFIACAQYLVDQKYTFTDRLFINGGSAGGMLMGAVTNMRPDLFRGVLAEVPWMDVVTDMENPDLPLTTLEYDEWGHPDIREQYDYMLSWSPYDNVADAEYPAIFATGGLNDTQVPYFSPAKWVAKVREHNKSRNPVLFKVNMGAGHSGESGRFERQKLTATKYAFMLDLVGRK